MSLFERLNNKRYNLHEESKDPFITLGLVVLLTVVRLVLTDFTLSSTLLVEIF